ncbi:MAG: hypothetical protein ACRDO1_05410 [Nocardioidaceae bacterium]
MNGRDDVARAERWFLDNGLPYFVAEDHRGVSEALHARRLVAVAGVSVLAAAVAGVLVGVATDDPSLGFLTGLVALGALAGLYALVALRLAPIAGWAVRRSFGSLGLLFPLVTRALPLLLLFVTFFFINTEVWQVASSMDRPLLWTVVLLFAAVAVVFLLARLPEELDRVGHELEGDRLVDCCADTPLHEAAARLGGELEIEPVRGLRRANLLLLLVIAQAIQVLLLSLAVFAFFAVFGRLAITAEVVESWIGRPPSYLGDVTLVSTELFQVSVFLAAFSGLYFTVYAVNDDSYRKQFFTSVTHELERALGVLAVYRALRRAP